MFVSQISNSPPPTSLMKVILAMIKYISYFSHRIPIILRMIPVLILSGCAVWLGRRVPVNHTKTFAPSNSLPDLRGQAAVERLKQEGLYDTLAEAVAAARYDADALPSPDAYQFSNPAQDLRATFTSSGARVVSSPGGRDRELTFKLIGYGYGSRITNLVSRNIVARRNRIEHEYSLQKQSEIRNPKSEIVEWFVNSEAGIEHGFTLPEPPPAERGGDESLRVEMEIGGDFETRLDAAGQAVSFACGRRCGGLTYNKLHVYDAREREVAARFELDGKRLAIVVEDGEAEYPVTIDPLFAQQAKLTASDGAAEDFFGFSVAISGDTVVVGAFSADSPNMDQGAAYIFVRDATTTPPSWTQQAKLTASDGAAIDAFGTSVVIDGDTVVVGAPGADAPNIDQGAAYIFVRDATTTPPCWSQKAKLTARDGAAIDSFGFSVAIDGDTVVVGAPNADAPNIDPGAAYIFVRDATTTPPSWTQQAKLTTRDGAAFDKFGNSVAINRDTVVVGAVVANTGLNVFQGAAYIFVRDATTTPLAWPQQAKLTARDAAEFDLFGFSVAIDGDTVVVGAIGADIAQNMDQGAAYIFVRDATTTPPSWTQQAQLTARDGAAFDSFGFSVAIDGDTVVGTADAADKHLEQDAA